MTPNSYEELEARLRGRRADVRMGEHVILQRDTDCIEAADALADLRERLDEARAEIVHLRAGKRPFSDSHSTAVIATQVKELDALHVRVTESWTRTKTLRAENERLTRERDEAVDVGHYANGVAELAIKQRDATEAEAERLRKVAEAAEVIFNTFSIDEAQGFRSRDRQYAITILKPYLSSKED